MKSAGRKFCSLKIVVRSIVIAVLSYAVSLTASAEEKVTVTAFNYPPYMDESLSEKGLFCELVYEAYKAAGCETSFKFYPLKRSTLYVAEGRELAQLGTEWNFSEESRKDVHPVSLFFYRKMGFYLKDRFKEIRFKKLSDLKGYKLGVILGSSDSAILMKNKYLEVEQVPTMEQMFKKLYAGRSDIVFAPELSALSFIEANYPGEVGRFAVTDDVLQDLLGQVIFSKKYPDYEKYVVKFQEGLNLIRDNGNYFKVLEKYYGKNKVPQDVGDISRKVYFIPNE